MDQSRLDRAFDVLRHAVEDGRVPGMAAAAGDRDGLFRLEAWGLAQEVPKKEPMTKDTTFDIASLSKLVGTWMCVLPLLKSGRLTLETTLSEALDFPVRPEYRDVTVWNLLTHTAGFMPGMHVEELGDTRRARIQALLTVTRPQYPRGEKVLYSDISFICLGEIVARYYGKSLDRAARGLWDELGMTHTLYNPGPEVYCAATEIKDGAPRRGQVHDEVAHALGGVAGHAGVFSTAEDLGLFCRAILPGGRADLFGEKWLRESFTNQTARLGENRCLGWIEYRRKKEGGVVGHTGFTGTSIWMDTEKSEYVIILSNRVHPTRERYAMGPLRQEAMDILYPEE